MPPEGESSVPTVDLGNGPAPSHARSGHQSSGHGGYGDYDPTQDPNSDTYFDRGRTVDTGEETEADAEAEVDADHADDNAFEQLVALFTRGGQVDANVNDSLDAQTRQLIAGQDIRQPPPLEAANYGSYPHPEMQRMVTEDVDPDGVGEMGDTWIEAGNAMVRFQDGVATAINSSETDWKGSAGDSARGFMASVGDWVGTAGQGAQLAGTQTNVQAQALGTAKSSMPEPVDFDVDAANRDLASTTNPFEAMSKYQNYMQTYQEQQAAREQAAQVLNTYDNSLAGSSLMPAFGPPPAMSNTGEIDHPGGDDKVDLTGGKDLRNIGKQDDGKGGIGNPDGSGGDDGKGNFQLPTDPGGPDGPGGPNGPGGPDGPGGPQLPGPGDTWPGGPGGPEIPGPGGPQLPPGPGGQDDGTDTQGNDTFPSPGPFYPPGSGPIHNGPGGPGGPGGNYPGGMPPFGGMPGSGGGDYGRGGVGGRGGFGPGGASGRGGAGAGGMGGMGAGRGEGDEDDEHQRPSYLVEGDPDAVFGTDQMTAPPVIGE